MARVRIGDMLVAANLLTPERLSQALEFQARDGRRLGEIVVAEGWISEVQLVQVLSQQLSVPWVSLHHVDFSRQLLNLVPRSLAEQFCLLPIYVRHVRSIGDTLYVAMDDPSNDDALRTIEETAALPVRPMIAPPSDIRSAIRVYYGGAAAPPPRTVRPAPIAGSVERVAVAPAPPLPADVVGVAPVAPELAPAPPVAPVPPPGATTASLARAATPPPPPPPASSPPATTSSSAPPAAAPDESGRPSAEPMPLSRRRPGSPPMVTLTLLDGTTVQLPRTRPAAKPEQAPPDESLTARDLVAALRAAARDVDVSDILPEKRWEPLLAALLAVLLRKQLIADWEFVEEWKRTELT